MKGLSFTNVSRRIMFHYPYNGIFHDIDGSLTGKGAGSWATVHLKHLEHPECEVKLEEFDGIICDNTVQIRAITFSDESPYSIDYLRLLRYDDSIISAMN